MRGMVGVGGHDVAHMLPPILTFRRLGDSLPEGFVLNSDMGKELANRNS
jgi:hypothetical protein